MTKVTVWMGGALGVAIVTILFLAQRQGENSRVLQQLQQDRDSVREEANKLHQDLERLQEQRGADPSESQPQIDASELERLREGESELLRLRNEVTRLREELKRLAPDAIEGMVLKGRERFETPESYQPPVEITVVAKTDSTNIRLSYAADQVIFNWEVDPSQLRVDGGPASGQHQRGAGRVPVGEYVTVQWTVTPTNQEIFVNGELRFQHQGDYSQINRPVSVFPAEGSTVTIKGFEVKRLASAAR